jgi:hypothetical protein
LAASLLGVSLNVERARRRASWRRSQGFSQSGAHINLRGIFDKEGRGSQKTVRNFEREIKDNNRVMMLLETVGFQRHIMFERAVLKGVD